MLSLLDTWNLVIKRAGHIVMGLGVTSGQVLQLSDVHVRILSTGRGVQKLMSKMTRDPTESAWAS